MRGVGETALLELNHLLGRFRLCAWIIGEGRSGTTWLSTLIDPLRRFRHLFEPFHPHRSPELASAFSPYMYLRRGARHDALEYFADRVFTGRHRSSRSSIGPRRLLYDGLVVKDIFATLMASWVRERHPYVRPILLLRHPFDVAHSKMQLADWYWFGEPAELIGKTHLMEDHLAPHEQVLASVRTPFEKYVTLWCVSTLVALRCFSPGEVQVVFYESLRQDLDATLETLYRFLGRSLPHPSVLEGVAKRPSRTSRSSGGQPLVAPIVEESPEGRSDEARRGLKIIEAFGLDDLYGPGGAPRPSAAARILESP